MADVVRPPDSITPSGYFEQWLPSQLGVGVPQGLQPMTVRVRLDGADGGAWDLRVEPDGVAIGPADGAEAEITLQQSVRDWRALAVGEPGAIDLVPHLGPSHLLLVDPAAQQAMGNVRGTLRFEVTEFNGRTWALLVKLGTQPMAAQPDATISLDAETYAAMLERKLPAMQAYFNGRIRVTGDANLAMQVAMAMMPRFNAEART